MGFQKTDWNEGAAPGISAAQLDRIEAGIFDAMPVAAVIPWAGDPAAIPATWLLCDGQAVNRTTYADLFAKIATIYGIGDGSSTFNVPNLKGRIPVGLDAAQVEFDTRGETGGAKTHTLLASEIPSHTHGINHDHGAVTSSNPGDHTHGMQFFSQEVDQGPVGGTSGFRWINDVPDQFKSTQGGGGHTHSVDLPNFSGTSGATGGGGAHNNLQPYIVLSYLIKS
jgi:microcystin-dependent protein